MKSHSLLKRTILDKLLEKVAGNVELSEAAIASAKASRDSDTKSSAGDKYETGRAMMQQEMEQHSMQLNNALQLQSELTRINTDVLHANVSIGSLVITNEGNYFLAVALGAVEMEGQTFHAISLASPLGMLLKGKMAGDRFEFRGRELKIEKVY